MQWFHRRKKLTTLWRENEHYLNLFLQILMIYLVHGVITEDIVLEMKASGQRLGVFFSLLSASAAAVLCLSQSHRPLSLGLFLNVKKQHLVVALASFLSQSSAGKAVLLLRFNTVQLFKSSKVVFVMVLSRLLLFSPMSRLAVALAFSITLGLFVFSAADVRSRKGKEDSLMGFVYITAGLLLSGYSSVVQQASLQGLSLQSPLKSPRRLGQYVKEAKHIENSKIDKKRRKGDLLLFSNLMNAFMLFMVCLGTGELSRGVSFFANAGPRLCVQQILALFLSAYGQQVVLTFTQEYGATLCSIVLTVRKTVTFVVSVVLFPKPFNFGHLFGLTSVTLSAVLLQRHLLNLKRKSKDSVLALARIV